MPAFQIIRQINYLVFASLPIKRQKLKQHSFCFKVIVLSFWSAYQIQVYLILPWSIPKWLTFFTHILRKNVHICNMVLLIYIQYYTVGRQTVSAYLYALCTVCKVSNCRNYRSLSLSLRRVMTSSFASKLLM